MTRLRFNVLRAIAMVLFAASLLCVIPSHAQDSSPVIPKTWDETELRLMELPLADTNYTPAPAPPAYYYSLGTLPIYKSYPIYAPGKEPPHYLEWLEQQEPAVAFDPSTLKTKEDWIKAGELVFNAPIFYNAVNSVAEVRDEAWYKRTGVPVTKDGLMPFSKYVIRKKGRIETGEFSCATCHTRVLPDGTMVAGAQSNYPLGRLDELDMKKHVGTPEEKQFKDRARFGFVLGYQIPWLQPDPLAEFDKLTLEQFASMNGMFPPGVQARPGVSFFEPVQVPSLIGVKDSVYLDHTGLQLHRSIGDMMRYAALNQGASFLSSYGGFIPRGPRLPDPKTVRERYSDEQLYALSLYIYSLKPPPNPNQFGPEAARGQEIFKAEGCGYCHTPPLYTNNKLTPVDGFRVPAEHLEKYDIITTSVGTDPELALRTRRATGYYKIPSLRGVWYRGPFGHTGSVQTLEDWFDPKRVNDDYVPTGFRGFGPRTRAVKGHVYGLGLSPADRNALIAFLKTL